MSLADCLACSGCVTSSEAVLIEKHSIEEFMTLFKDPDHMVIVALSSQSVTSLSQFYKSSSDLETFKKL